MSGEKVIPVVFITDKNFIMQTGVAITSLVNSKNPGTQYNIYIVAAECDKGCFDVLSELSLNGCKLTCINASLEKYQGINQIAHIPIACLLKFDICDLIETFDKILYLDGDVIVRKDLSELYDFEIGDAYIAGVPSIEMVYSDERLVNAGIMLFNAKKMRDDHMAERLVEVRKSLGDRGSMDQQTFNMVMKGSMRFLPLKYNFIADKIVGSEKRRFKLEDLNCLYNTDYKSKKEMIDDAVIIHFATGGKPWKYSFVPCSDEWYRWFLQSPFRNEKLERKGYIQARSNHAIQKLKKEGLVGIVKRVIELIRARIEKPHYTDWG